MTTFGAPDMVQFLQADQPDARSDQLVIVGVVRNSTASSVELAVDDLANWLTLPTALIEEATWLRCCRSTRARERNAFTAIFYFAEAASDAK